MDHDKRLPPWAPGSAAHDFLAWLAGTVASAVSAAERHDAMRLRIRELRSRLESRHGLASIQACPQVRALATPSWVGLQCWAFKPVFVANSLQLSSDKALTLSVS